MAKLWQVPLRLAAGTYVLQQGLEKRSADDQRAAGLQGMAAQAYPAVKEVEAQQFAQSLATAEVGIGAALLLPFVPGGLAGAALMGFAGGLLGLYLRTPGMRKEGSLAPTSQGIGLAKDVWLFGIGAALVADAIQSRD
jgi:hypothetical protein